MTKITAKQRDTHLREIAAELKRIRDIPIRSLPDDALHQLITARNWLRAIAITLILTTTSHAGSGMQGDMYDIAPTTNGPFELLFFYVIVPAYIVYAVLSRK